MGSKISYHNNELVETGNFNKGSKFYQTRKEDVWYHNPPRKCDHRSTRQCDRTKYWSVIRTNFSRGYAYYTETGDKIDARQSSVKSGYTLDGGSGATTDRMMPIVVSLGGPEKSSEYRRAPPQGKTADVMGFHFFHDVKLHSGGSILQTIPVRIHIRPGWENYWQRLWDRDNEEYALFPINLYHVDGISEPYCSDAANTNLYRDAMESSKRYDTAKVEANCKWRTLTNVYVKIKRKNATSYQYKYYRDGVWTAPITIHQQQEYFTVMVNWTKGNNAPLLKTMQGFWDEYYHAESAC